MMQKARDKDGEGRLRLCWVKKKREEQEQSGGQNLIKVDTYIGKNTLTGTQSHINIPSKLPSWGDLRV
jgi:hypothetical protein